MAKTMRVAIYLRVSTGEQTVENQRRDLEAAAAQRGWEIVAVFADEGISGAKGRDKRPGLDRMMKDATRGKFDVLMVWAVDRLGRSTIDLMSTLQELHGAKVDLFLHQQALDTTTPAGKAMFGMMGIFAEFERSMIQTRVKAGLQRAKAAGKVLGRKPIGAKVEAEITTRLESGIGMLKIAKELGIGTGTVQRVQKTWAANRAAA